ncbi:MAG: methyltransferase domain-containing protein [Gammaproteobacteria bacterium]|nr:methyltransferase domain-containing protein [Gammaproteobacteria bacterium]
MSDLFKEKAGDWDASQMKIELSSAIGSTILAQVSLNNEMKVMDFGAGTGLLTSHILPRVNSISAVDTSASMLDKLAGKPEFHGKVTAVCQDITRKKLDAKFDLIISAMALHHVEDTAGLMETFAEHLNAGGQIALADLDKEDGTFHPADVEGVFHHGFEHEALKTIIESKGFADVQFHTAHTVHREDKSYPIFLVVASKN